MCEAGGLYSYNYYMTGNETQYVTISLLDVPRSSWVERSACASESAEFLSPKPDAAKCKAICATCPVQALCLAYAIANDEKDGVWGGMTRAERLKKKGDMDLSRVPLEFRDHYLQMEGRVKRNVPSAPHYVRNPNLDLVIDPDFIALLDAM